MYLTVSSYFNTKDICRSKLEFIRLRLYLLPNNSALSRATEGAQTGDLDKSEKCSEVRE